MISNGIAPPFTPAQARTRLCPVLSTLSPDNKMTRVNCMAGECALWDWLIPPSDLPALKCEGLGKCSIPRAAYAHAAADARRLRRAS